jgi:hypothetical protein
LGFQISGGVAGTRGADMIDPNRESQSALIGKQEILSGTIGPLLS